VPAVGQVVDPDLPLSSSAVLSPSISPRNALTTRVRDSLTPSRSS
jgi:hypothetical protein